MRVCVCMHEQMRELPQTCSKEDFKIKAPKLFQKSLQEDSDDILKLSWHYNKTEKYIFIETNFQIMNMIIKKIGNTQKCYGPRSEML